MLKAQALANFDPNSDSKEFYQKFFAFGNFYAESSQQVKLVIESAKITIAESKSEELNFSLIVGGKDEEQLYQFPLDPEAKPKIKEEANKQAIYFAFEIEANKRIIIEFKADKNGKESSNNFKETLEKLYLQLQNKRTMNLNQNQQNKILPEVNPNLIGLEKNPEENILVLLKKIKENEKPIISSFGKFDKVNLENKNCDPTILLEKSIFAIFSGNQNLFEILIFNETREIFYRQKIEEGFNFSCDEAKNNMVWIKIEIAEIKCFAFFFEKKIVLQISEILAAIQNQLKTIANPEKISPDNSNTFSKESEKILREPIFEISNLSEIKEKSQNDFPESNGQLLLEEITQPNSSVLPIFSLKTFAQGKMSNCALTSDKKGLSIHTIDSQTNDFGHIARVPIMKAFDSKLLVPRKMHFQESDKRVVFLEEDSPSRVFYLDLETGKVLGEFKRPASELRDISLLGSKQAAEGQGPLFLSVGEKDLF